MTIEVPIPRATPVAIEAVKASLKKVPGHKSTVKNGVLFLEPDEADAIDAATREHARELLKANRSANSYRDVLLREVRKAIAAATGKKPAAPKKAPAKKAAAKKSAPAKKSSPKKAPAAKKATPAKRATRRERSEARAVKAREELEAYEQAKAESKAVKDWEAQPEAERGPRPETPALDKLTLELAEKEAKQRSATEARKNEQVTPRLKAS